eukprot:CAMPEP_0170826506 /NCGR_PEP_ID=MMETSP0733-20121128/46639_1 /TAXON_ID=186038 /ORGANISM="Fragilariopsis kerguelensis, Strain L26-C5" /LENGTH=43 /DNA_ID= /DNA_START= /DNA_END= /DNA_ORIENTATION=
MTCVGAVSVIIWCTNSNPGAIFRQRHRIPGLVAGGLAINVTSH